MKGQRKAPALADMHLLPAGNSLNSLNCYFLVDEMMFDGKLDQAG